jgi:nucleoside 2-deoxyribosyltransferase
MKKVFLICPVRNASIETQDKINTYIKKLENNGISVYYPHRDTDQSDPIGVNIFNQNRQGVKDADEIHIWYDHESRGSLIDLGMAWALEKPLVIANSEDIVETNYKSIENVILRWAGVK